MIIRVRPSVRLYVCPVWAYNNNNNDNNHYYVYGAVTYGMSKSWREFARSWNSASSAHPKTKPADSGYLQVRRCGTETVIIIVNEP